MINAVHFSELAIAKVVEAQGFDWLGNFDQPLACFTKRSPIPLAVWAVRAYVKKHLGDFSTPLSSPHG